jgi:hypothetical protein
MMPGKVERAQKAINSVANFLFVVGAVLTAFG